MRHQYTRVELESITQETAIYIEGAGIAQLQWGGLEIAEGCRDGYLYCKHIKPFIPLRLLFYRPAPRR